MSIAMVTLVLFLWYRIDLNFGGAKLWRIDSISPNLTLQFFKLSMRTRVRRQFLEMSILNYFHLSVDKTI